MHPIAHPYRGGGLLALVIALLGATGCPAGESARCRDLCKSVVACVEALNQDKVVIDETECTITCTSLERDPEGKQRVDEYAACVRNADCTKRLSCNEAPGASVPAAAPDESPASHPAPAR